MGVLVTLPSGPRVLSTAPLESASVFTNTLSLPLRKARPKGPSPPASLTTALPRLPSSRMGNTSSPSLVLALEGVTFGGGVLNTTLASRKRSSGELMICVPTRFCKRGVFSVYFFLISRSFPSATLNERMWLGPVECITYSMPALAM